MRFEPGPGLGGHCIPIDPFYLTWKAREFDFTTRFIELAGEVNQNMPYYCRSRRLAGAEPRRRQVADAARRCSCSASPTRPTSPTCASRPAVKLIELLQNAGAEVSYHDPHVPAFDEHGTRALARCRSTRRLRRRRDRDGPLGDRLRRARRRRAARRRPPQRDRPARDHGATRSGSCERCRGRPGRPRLLGQEPRPQLRRPRRADLALRSLGRAPRTQFAARHPQARVDRRRSASCSPTPSSTRS